MTIWFSRKTNGVKRYCSKSISLSFQPRDWKMIKAWNNGAKRGIKEHRCFDFNIHFLGILFSYTNWDYN
jgi:hypothetical protein